MQTGTGEKNQDESSREQNRKCNNSEKVEKEKNLVVDAVSLDCAGSTNVIPIPLG